MSVVEELSLAPNEDQSDQINELRLVFLSSERLSTGSLIGVCWMKPH